MVYVGQTRSRALISELAARGFGEMTQPREAPPRRTPWVLDNGAYAAWKAGSAFDAGGFAHALDAVAAYPVRPSFVVAPDVVAGGLASLALSVEWSARVRAVAPPYLVVQDGMTEADVCAALDPFAGLFVGGSTAWKMTTASAWVQFAHAHGRPCHVGRVGTARRVRWAARIGVDSIDSCLPLWSRAQMARFIAALDMSERQGELF